MLVNLIISSPAKTFDVC